MIARVPSDRQHCMDRRRELGWFSKTAKATASALGPAQLRVHRTVAPDLDIDLTAAPWIGFVQVGDDQMPVYEGWWLIGTPDGAVAVNEDCPMVDVLLRDGDLAPQAQAVPDKFILFLMSRPMMFRGRSAADGVAILDAEQSATLKSKGTTEHVERIGNMPIVS